MLGAKRSVWIAVVVVVAPLLAAVALYRLDEITAAQLPGYGAPVMAVSNRKEKLWERIELVGKGLLSGPEDFAYDPDSGALYTGCEDGWIKKVVVSGHGPPVVTNYSFVGGRPLGLALNAQKEIIVCDTVKGLLRVSEGGGEVEVLVNEANGVRFGLTDGVDVGRDGTVYFTDASYKYDLEHHALDIFEGRPHGRLMSFDPATKRTTVLFENLYFANGVAVSPDNTFIVFCETTVARCQKYYIEGEKKGELAVFIENLPGFPDNIRYDGHGLFWIGLPAARDFLMNKLMGSPSIRKALLIAARFGLVLGNRRTAGVLAVNMEGEAVAQYWDAQLDVVTTGLKIGDYLYFGHLHSPHLTRFNMIHSS